MHLSSDKFKVDNQPSLIDVASTALVLQGTAQFIDALKSDFANFKESDTFRKAEINLKGQAFLMYQWSLTRYCVENPLRMKYIRNDAFDITVDNFVIEKEEIQKYIANPKFLWRFSVRNYQFFVTFFKSSKKSTFFFSKFETADIDDSPLVDYIKPIKNYVKDKFKKSVNLTITSTRKPYYFDISLITNFMKKHFEPINEFKTSEFLFSDDYYLHEVQPDATYEDFVCHLLCGQTKNFISPLLLWHNENKGTSTSLRSTNSKYAKRDTIMNFKTAALKNKIFSSLKNDVDLSVYDADTTFRSIKTVNARIIPQSPVLFKAESKTFLAVNKNVSPVKKSTKTFETVNSKAINSKPVNPKSVNSKFFKSNSVNSSIYDTPTKPLWSSNVNTDNHSTPIKSSLNFNDDDSMLTLSPTKPLVFKNGTNLSTPSPTKPLVFKNNSNLSSPSPTKPLRLGGNSSIQSTPTKPLNYPSSPTSIRNSPKVLKKGKVIKKDEVVVKTPEHLLHAYEFIFPNKGQNPTLRLECIKEILEHKRKSCATTHRLYHTDWLHEYLMSIDTVESQFYKFALKTFGSKCHVNYFRFDDIYGVSVRTGWSIPCPTKVKVQMAQNFVYSLYHDTDESIMRLQKSYENNKAGYQLHYNPTITINKSLKVNNLRYDRSFAVKINNKGFNFSAFFDPKQLNYNYKSTNNTIESSLSNESNFKLFHINKFREFQKNCILGKDYTGFNDIINSLTTSILDGAESFDELKKEVNNGVGDTVNDTVDNTVNDTANDIVNDTVANSEVTNTDVCNNEITNTEVANTDVGNNEINDTEVTNIDVDNNEVVEVAKVAKVANEVISSESDNDFNVQSSPEPDTNAFVVQSSLSDLEPDIESANVVVQPKIDYEINISNDDDVEEGEEEAENEDKVINDEVEIKQSDQIVVAHIPKPAGGLKKDSTIKKNVSVNFSKSNDLYEISYEAVDEDEDDDESDEDESEEDSYEDDTEESEIEIKRITKQNTKLNGVSEYRNNNNNKNNNFNDYNDAYKDNLIQTNDSFKLFAPRESVNKKDPIKIDENNNKNINNNSNDFENMNINSNVGCQNSNSPPITIPNKSHNKNVKNFFSKFSKNKNIKKLTKNKYIQKYEKNISTIYSTTKDYIDEVKSTYQTNSKYDINDTLVDERILREMDECCKFRE